MAGEACSGEAWPRDGGRRGAPPDAGEACSGEAWPRPYGRCRGEAMPRPHPTTPRAIHDVPDRGFREVFQVLKTCFPGAADRSRAPPGSATHGLLAA